MLFCKGGQKAGISLLYQFSVKKLRVTVNGVTYDVDVEILEDDDHPGYGYASTAQYSQPSSPIPAAPAAPVAPAPAPSAKKASSADSKNVTSPIPGTVIEIKVGVGDTVKEHQPLIVLEAMKMNTNISSPVGGKVKEIKVKAGDTVQQDQVLLTFE